MPSNPKDPYDWQPRGHRPMIGGPTLKPRPFISDPAGDKTAGCAYSACDRIPDGTKVVVNADVNLPSSVSREGEVITAVLWREGQWRYTVRLAGGILHYGAANTFIHAPLPDPKEAAGVNPKDAIGSKKPPTWSVVPRWVSLMVGRVMAIGAAKYGKFNYRTAPVRASIYIDAAERHMALWADGEENDEETGVSHLASVIGCCTILLDAQANKTWHDDREKTGLVRMKLDELQKIMEAKPLPAYQG